ncbi:MULTISPECIES: ribokinase [unclassified Streptomyces]|uniref:ribokinase n=1 Tax=unclassified Streptomyces TaxID=2593676 RepID=UPI000DAEFA04|nr:MULTISPECIES: ribokinase [unclassified Streptomyces]PZT76653.1 ribokinase [Streptomyces sp. AC1-42W]PZT79391.1 ribokinase [Streptomyces sp. AC1-42T]
MPSITVVGSVNRDLVLTVEDLPRPGETVLSSHFVKGVGGKGANQAVAAARLGSRVRLVARTGTDGAGILGALESEGVDVATVRTDKEAPTGIAAVVVDAAGENSIVVHAGANARLGVGDLPQRLVRVPGEVVVVQHEIASEVVDAAVLRARGQGGIVVLNPAPARPVARETLAAVDVLVPNQGELATLLGVDRPATVDAVRVLLENADLPCRAVVVTLGADGAVLKEAHSTQTTHVPAPLVDAVDTVGAGDTFCGALADALGRGEDLASAVARAVRAASHAVTGLGAQSSMPYAAQLDAPAVIAAS